MKRLFLFLIFLFLVAFAFWFFFQKTPPSSLPESEEESSIDNFQEKMKEVSFDGQKFLFLEQKINEAEKLILFPNFVEKMASTELLEKNHCRFLASGGFYDQEDRPLGWFFSQEKLWKKEIKSALLNGFFFQNQQKEIIIDDVFPVDTVAWGLQTGPILIFKDEPLILEMGKDERARRMVVALSQADELFFLVLTGPDSLASGPLLADLPFIVEKIGRALKADFKIAINLDGGTASAFISQEKTIKEYNPIGSFFCLY